MSLFKMPSLGADMESAILMEWKVKEGDCVKKGDIIAEIEASKGVIEIEVFEDGIVEKLLVEEETECAVGTPLAMIRSEGEAVETVTTELPESAIETTEVKVTEPPQQPSPPTPPRDVTAARSDERVSASPLARKRAKELGVDLESLKQNGKTIHAADVQSSDKQTAKEKLQQPKETTTVTQEVHRAPQADSMRQAIAAAMSRSNAEIPHYYLSTPINMSPALKWLEARNAKRSIQERILPAAMVLYATVQALKKVPQLNGFWKEGVHEISEAIHPGFAIALRQGGLLTPALLDAHTMDIDTMMQAMGDLISRTRASKLRGSELSQQTITITNLGDLGVESVFGVIYPPQVALVGFGKTEERPWIDADGGLGIRKVMQATLAGDHRATDGRTGAQFLDHLKTILEHPETLNGDSSG